MKAKSRITILPTLIGSGVGFVSFLVFGALHGVVYGGYMGLIMAGALLGTPVEPGILSRILIGGGMVLGVVVTLFFFLVVGALVGTVIGYAYSLFFKKVIEHGPESEMSVQPKPDLGK
ncbi:MAG: hypothetical protein HY537_00995 [Deltaproteobacteria bacterium]|nr:hypothetical protein [Deltaproteobacteria bacterium]